MKKKIIIILATCCSALAFGQIAPVSSRTTFKPPYSSQVSEWAENITVTLLLRDLSVTKGRVYLRMHIESSSISIETRPLYSSQVFQLDGGIAIQIDGDELRALFKPENLVFSGISASEFIRNGSRLPEGIYKLWFEVYEWTSNLKVSAAEGFATINLQDIEPPVLNFPENNSMVTAETPQSIMFSWTPRHQTSANRGFQSIYDFELVQIPQHYDGDLQILFETTQKYAEKTLFQTQFRYNEFDEELVYNQRYAFRVRVRSAGHNDESFQFRNNGYSEIFTFQYIEKCNKATNLQSDSKTPYSVDLSWTGNDFKNQYLISYRRANDETNAWFSQQTGLSEILLEDLSPEQTYEIKIQTRCEFNHSEESEPIFITTPALFDTNLNCGVAVLPSSDTCTKPLETLTKSQSFQSNGTTIRLHEISGGNGVFSGKGYVQMPTFGFIKARVVFENIRINECFQHTEGVIRVKN